MSDETTHQGQEEPIKPVEDQARVATETPEEGGGSGDDAFDAAFSEASAPPAPQEKGKGKAKEKTAQPAEAKTDPPADSPPAAAAKDAEAKNAEAKDVAANSAEAKTDAAAGKTALEEAEEAGKALAERSAAAEKTAGGEATTAGAAKAEGEAKPADQAKDAAAWQGLTIDKLPEKWNYNGQEYPLADVIADYGEDVVALNLACANATLQQAVEQGLVVPAEKFHEEIGRLQAQVQWESHLNQVSSLARLDARAVLADGRFQEWIGKQNANIQLLYDKGQAADCAKVIRAWYDTLAGARNIKEDANRAKEKERREDVHRHSVRDGVGRYAAKDEGGKDDFEGAFAEAVQNKG